MKNAHHFLALCSLFLIGGILPFPAMGQSTRLISRGYGGQEANGGSSWPTVSGNGRYIAFHSAATNLVPGQEPAGFQIYRYDQRTGETVLVSSDAAGTAGDSSSLTPSISADGNLIAFYSYASNLVPGDGNGTFDVFVKNVETGAIEIASVDSAGNQGIDASPFTRITISPNGRYVSFDALSSFSPLDANQYSDVYVRDRSTGLTHLASINSQGTPANAWSMHPHVSDTGFVVFVSAADNLGGGVSIRKAHVYGHDLASGLTELISKSNNGTPGVEDSNWPSVSADGSQVAFESDATNLVEEDGNGSSDIFLLDRLAGVLTRESVGPGGAEGPFPSHRAQISANGKYLTFFSLSNNLVGDDTNPHADYFTRHLRPGVNYRMSVGDSGEEGPDNQATSSVAGSHVFTAFATGNRLDPLDTGLYSDVYVRGTQIFLDQNGKEFGLGDPLTLESWGGIPGTPVLVYVISVNGQIINLPLIRGTFNGIGEHLFVISIPADPALLGLDLVMASLGFGPNGDIDISNPAGISIR